MTINLYHVTTAKGLKGALDAGAILPGARTGERCWRTSRESLSEKIYLAGTSAQAKAIGESLQRARGGTAYILQVEIDDANLLCADEDSRAENWQESLKATRTCAYRGGIIPSWKVVDVLPFDLSDREKTNAMAGAQANNLTLDEMGEEYNRMRHDGANEEARQYGNFGHLIK